MSQPHSQRNPSDPVPGPLAARRWIDLLVRHEARTQPTPEAVEALERLGESALPSIVDGIRRIQELQCPADVYAVETFAELLGGIKAPCVVEELKRLTGRLRTAAREDSTGRMRDCCRSALLRVHVILFSLGTRDQASDDLLALLADGRRRVPIGLVELLAKVGTVEAILPLTRLYSIEQAVSWSGAHQISQAIREIVRRERLPLGVLAGQASPEERLILEKILSRSRLKKWLRRA